MIIPYASYVTSPGVEKSFSIVSGIRSVSGYPVQEVLLDRFTVLSGKDRSVTVRFHGEASLRIPCGLCLTPVDVRTEFEAERKFDPDKKTDEDGYPSDCFTPEGLDADRLILEEIALALPIRVLCSPTCKGICPKCFQNRNDGSCKCGDGGSETRMAALLKEAFDKSRTDRRS